MSRLSQVQAELEQRLAQLERRVSRIAGDLRRPGNPDWSERAIETENDEVLERLDASERAEIQQIRNALDRFRSGDYGTCAGCGEEIDARRLEASPYATLCIGCAD